MDIFDKCFSFKQQVETVKREGKYFYFRKISSAQGPEVILNGHRMIMLGSNNYLGLTEDARVKEAAIAAIKKYGTGCAGSRLLNGTVDIHEALEAQIASFFGKEAAVVFSTGMQANLGCIQALVTQDSIAILDKFDHASIIDGCRLAYGDFKRYPHNDMKSLERILKCHPERGKLILVDGIFSMEGDLANLPEIVSLARKYGARVMVDDAHGIGVMGENGKGTAEHFHLEKEVDIIMGTFSKSLATIGGFIAARKDVVEYVKHVGRALLFSASLAPPLVAAASTAFKIIEAEPERREQLWRNAHFWLNGLKSLGFDTGYSTTPIVPVIIGEADKTFEMCYYLEEYGVFVSPVVPPAVPPGRALLRTSVMATHTQEQLERALDAFAQAGRKAGIIS
ncbi:MAG: pyridoxal phosphate-dependent aminotransferase family protein [Candidatus Desulfofervidaceae bacterium]|nr:pyridoxal phosphate-dependent aminotransferase family protein [Candidatus Desulfofervidaceae bacterium]